MRGRGKATAATLFLAISLLGALAAAPALAASADWLYEPTTFTEVRLTLPTKSIEELEAEPKEYVHGTFSLAETNGKPGSAGAFSTPIEVGIELKGSLGSLRTINQKAAFKIKVDKYVEGQRFEGLEKLTLNNMVQDASMIHEATTYGAFHAMNVPSPHVGYTYLTVNGKSYGLHLNIETQDAQSLEKYFGTPFTTPPQHLYEGEYQADVSTVNWRSTSEPRWKKLEVSEGKKKEKGDLEGLVTRVAEPSPAFGARMSGYADLGEMTRDWIVEKFIGNWDGYAGVGPDEFHPNNYYLYSDVNGVFSILPWGTDQTWQQGYENLSFGSGGGILFTECVADTTPGGCASLYRAAGQTALGTLTSETLGTAARCGAAAILPWREYEIARAKEEGTNMRLPEYSLSATEAEIKATEKFIRNRPAALASYLEVAAPPPPSGEPACPPLRPIGGFPKPVVPTVPDTGSTGSAGAGPTTVPPSPAAPFGVSSRTAGSDVVTVGFTAPSAGTLTLRGVFGAGKNQATACRGAATVAAPGAVVVRCRLTGAFRARLGDRAAFARITAELTPASGPALTARTSLRLPRR